MEETTFDNHWKDVDSISTDEKVSHEITESWFKYFSKWNERLKVQNESYFHADYINETHLNFSFEKRLFAKSPARNYNDSFGLRSKLNTIPESFTKLKGYVTKIEDSYFEARLYDENNNTTYEIGEFDLHDVDKGDLDIFNVGSVFYWTFGHFKIKGQIKKQSEIRFQRIAVIDTDDFDEISEKAENINQTLNWE